MLLQRLVELSRTGQATPEMYQPTRVAWVVSLDAAGGLKGFVHLTGEGRNAARGQEMLAPTCGRSVAIKPKLLCDNGEYVLGLARGEDPHGKVLKRHTAFVELVRRCSEQTNEPAVAAVVKFLDLWREGSTGYPETFDASDVVTFEVAGIYPIELPTVQAFWARDTRELNRGRGATECLVCGEMKAPEGSHPKKIRGVPGGQTSGTALISANKETFESFGLKNSLTSPTCRDCAEGYADGLNGLLADQTRRLYVGPVVYVFWGARDEENQLLRIIDEPDPQDVAALISSTRTGRDVSALVSAPDFFLVALSASGGRAVVRDYLETSLEAARRNVARWFRIQRLEDGGRDYGYRTLAKAIVHQDLEELSPSLLASLLHTAVAGGPVSEGLLQPIARRNRAEGQVTRPRAALTRMVIVSNVQNGYTEDRLMTLELENSDPAYLCGRLFAELAAAQRAAQGDTGTTIVDRFYGTASSAPASVFGPLSRGAVAHLAKLRNTKPGAHAAIEARLQEIHSRLKTFPATLNLRQQALFSLGYYHQKAENSANARDRAAEKRKNASESGDDHDA